jgi:hypothetical protein
MAGNDIRLPGIRDWKNRQVRLDGGREKVGAGFQLRRPQVCDPIFHSSLCFANVNVRIPGLLPLCPLLSLRKRVEEMTT